LVLESKISLQVFEYYVRSRREDTHGDAPTTGDPQNPGARD